MTHSRFAVLAMLMMMGCGSQAGSDPSTTAPSAGNETADGAQQALKQKALTAPITGTIDGTSFTGLLKVTSFVVENDQILAVGQITNISAPDAAKHPGNAIATLKHATVKLPVGFEQPTTTTTTTGDVASSSAALAACDVLFLQLGPLDLDLLGLVVHLDQVTLNIDAQAGGGNLLGNLLCAIVGLLDPLAFLQNLAQIADLLNQIIGLIGVL